MFSHPPSFPRAGARLLFCVLAFAAARLAAGTAELRGLLIYPDGNRITGTLCPDGTFRSDRFGRVTFQPPEATFVADAGSAPTPPTPTPVPVVTTVPAAPVEGWKYHLNGFVDRTKESGTNRNETFLEFRTEGLVTASDHVWLEGRYEYKGLPEKIDKRRARLRGDWEHDLGPHLYTLYDPDFEYDGRNLTPPVEGISRLNYLLVQQQTGLGYRTTTRFGLTTRVAATWNAFYLDIFHYVTLHSDAPSLLMDCRWLLPQGFEVADRGDFYYAYRSGGSSGVENEFSLTKHFTPTFHITLRNEYRQNYPATGTNPDRRTRLLFGLDF